MYSSEKGCIWPECRQHADATRARVVARSGRPRLAAVTSSAVPSCLERLRRFGQAVLEPLRLSAMPRS